MLAVRRHHCGLDLACGPELGGRGISGPFGGGLAVANRGVILGVALILGALVGIAAIFRIGLGETPYCLWTLILIYSVRSILLSG